jgi:chemotaxis methyl-accepting protein methylase
MTKTSLTGPIDVVRGVTGRDLSLFDEVFLTKTLEKRLAATSAATSAAYVERLRQDAVEAEELCAALTVNYSEFFRDPLACALLEQVVLPDLIQRLERSARKEIRIWSAACAAGQEAYSIAILLEDLAAARECPVPYRIFATDISAAELAHARRGVYDEAEVRHVRLGQLERHLSRRGQSYTVAPALHEHVDFSSYDLLDGRSTCVPASIFGDFDIVFCCNVLFYYRPDVRRVILDKVRSCLSPRGYLVTGEAERAIVQAAGGFGAVAPPVAVFRKAR